MIPDWIISDTHWNHEKIVAFTNRPAEHNELMQENWRDLVRHGDTVLHLGDVAMGQREAWAKMPGWLPGKVLLIPGNHDYKDRVKYMQERWGWYVLWGGLQFEYKGWLITFSHYPANAILNDNPQGNTDLRIVRSLPSGILSVHGHMHDRPAPSPRHLNVCVEWMDYQPQRLTDLLDAKLAEIS